MGDVSLIILLDQQLQLVLAENTTALVAGNVFALPLAGQEPLKTQTLVLVPVLAENTTALVSGDVFALQLAQVGKLKTKTLVLAQPLSQPALIIKVIVKKE